MKKILSLKNISIKFGIKPIIENISFDLHIKEILTILGPNGAGKSTLIKIILGLITSNTGTIIYKKKIKIGYMPQKFFIDTSIPLTVKRFMTLKPSTTLTNIIQILIRVNANDLIEKQIHTLSTGEIQRVLLARALLNQPQLLILDEPTQGLDIKGQIIFYNLIDQIRNEFNCAVLMISHDLNFVMAKTDKIICMNKYIHCIGIPKDIALDPKFITMFGYYGAKKIGIYYHNHNLK